MSKSRRQHVRLWECEPRSATPIAPDDVMSLALPCDGVTPRLLHLVFDPFELWYASMERNVLVQAFALR
jgi:hypothetical protein